MNAMKKEDRRVRYTKLAIRESFLALLSEKPIEKISVTEICKRADINRGTFYSHYADPFDLKHQLELELTNAFAESRAALGVKRLSAVDIFRVLKENRELCGVFYGPHGDSKAMRSIIFEYSGGYVEDLLHDCPALPEAHLRCLREMLVSATSTMLKYWYEHEMKGDPEIMAKALKSFCDGGALSFVQQIESQD